MFFILSKLLGILFDPIIIVVLFLLLALIVKRLRRFFVMCGICLLLFFSNPFIINQILKRWEPQTVQTLADKHFKYGIVLTGMINYEATTGKINFLRSSDRIWQTVKLYKQGTIDKILISGGAVGLIYNDTVESVYLKNYLILIGLPEQDIITEEQSRNTYENASYTCALLSRDSIPSDSCLLITSAIHMRRAYGCFEKQGYTPQQYPVDHYSGISQNFVTSVLLPGVNALWQWNSLLHEWLGFISYRISGYL